ncbi:MAG: NAD(P)H-dependent glycerol-3-phosphate dehydrogenase [Buchananella hordeovulneris]|nr:NAD(P)H-dependent glycerol-3-phosphate dehydrogenase [Buchananella hordeovulneris]
MSAKVAVIGTGAWGTTFAQVCAHAGNQVVLWGRNPEVVDAINAHCNERYLPGLKLDPKISATTDMLAAIDGAQMVVVAIPSQTAREALAPICGKLGADTVVLSLMKGIELGTDLRMSEVLVEALGVQAGQVAVLSGPNLAKEIAQQQPTATVVAAQDEEVANKVAQLCAAPYFRPYTNTDVVGVELGGSVKNVIALAAGMALGLGYGLNTAATIITRGLVEITRLGLALGADRETFAGLAGMGDLVATCASPLSRNQRFGRAIAEGLSREEAQLKTGGTAEGVKSCQSIAHLARANNVDMPITFGVEEILHGNRDPREITQVLLSRPRKAEGISATPQE